MQEDATHSTPEELLDQLEAELAAGRITHEQMRQHVKADAERPIDLGMLRAFCDAWEQKVVAYGAMLRTIAEIATDRRRPDPWRQEARVDPHVERMTGRIPLWNEQVRTVMEFLIELRARSNQGPVRLGELSHATAHLLAAHVVEIAAQAWRDCQEISARSGTAAYLYPAGAAELFFSAHLRALPRPNDLLALLQLERAAAVQALREERRPPEPKRSETPNPVSIRTQTVNVEGQSVSVAAERVALKAPRQPEGKAGSRRISAQEVAAELERYRQAGGPYLDQRTLARLCGCRPATVNKAIQANPALRAWKEAALQARRQRAAPRAAAVDLDLVTARVPVEDPSVLPQEDIDRILEKLRRQAAANPEWVRALDEMSPDERVRIAQLYVDGDYELSPLEADPVPERPRRVKQHRRV